MDIEEILYTYPDDKVKKIFKEFRENPQQYKKEITEGIKVCKTALNILKEFEPEVLRIKPYIGKDEESFKEFIKKHPKKDKIIGKFYQVLGVLKQVLDFITYINELDDKKLIPVAISIKKYAKEKNLNWSKEKEIVYFLFSVNEISKKWKDRLNFLESLPILKHPYTTEELRLPTAGKIPTKGFKKEGKNIKYPTEGAIFYSVSPVVLIERDFEVLGAINKIFREQETFDIKTSYYEIAKEINKPFGGNTKKQIYESLKRLSEVGILFETGVRTKFKGALLRFVNEFFPGKNGELIIRMGLLNWYSDPKKFKKDLIQLPKPTINSLIAKRIYRELYSQKDKSIKMNWKNFVDHYTKFDSNKWSKREKKVLKALEELHEKKLIYYSLNKEKGIKRIRIYISYIVKQYKE